MQRWRGQDDCLFGKHFPAHTTHRGPRSPPHSIIPDRASTHHTSIPAARQTSLLHELISTGNLHCILLLLCHILISISRNRVLLLPLPTPHPPPVEHVGSRESGLDRRRRGGVFPDLSSLIYPFVRLQRMFRDRSSGSRCLVSALIFPMRSAIRPRVAPLVLFYHEPRPVTITSSSKYGRHLLTRITADPITRVPVPPLTSSFKRVPRSPRAQFIIITPPHPHLVVYIVPCAPMPCHACGISSR
ncbi:hypothetical protein BKA82DRAFT_2144842 [Pisolithus tinctorius]|nr:hypothetical protein BKA82DRAFT_2144842 [Pisolithus tinctorius]